jgi:murein DD-endopeptidase MepM/ murein hydrolase activator NlpD
MAVTAAAWGAFQLGRRSDPEPVALVEATSTSAPPEAPEPTTSPSTSTESSSAAPTQPAPITTPPSTAPTIPTYAFPIQPAAAADYPRSHHDYPAADIFAACGTAVVAPASGVVQEVTTVDLWNGRVDDPATRGGLSFSIVGDDGVRYYGSHVARLESTIVPGARVATGARIGDVGRTGNAAGTPCHLHFGISTPCGPGDVLRRRGEFWPQPYLDDWADGGQNSPSDLPDPTSC